MDPVSRTANAFQVRQNFPFLFRSCAFSASDHCIPYHIVWPDRCVDTTRVCARKLNIGETCTANKACLSNVCGTFAGIGVCGETCSTDSSCDTNWWCNTNYSPDICRPMLENGEGPCIKDAQCLSDRCKFIYWLLRSSSSCHTYIAIGIFLRSLSQSLGMKVSTRSHESVKPRNLTEHSAWLVRSACPIDAAGLNARPS